ncbi:hypothetical protein DL96DRAFT_1617617 [Flagelloscypha sp. PMI_526]|nr:hypothetical protein DL96DRAFT_1617617 [Flagelloscypha sp. PMI_526]
MSNLSTGDPFASLEWPYDLTPQGEPNFVANLTFWNSTSSERATNETLNDQFHNFLQAYCVDPPNDTCYFPGRCTNQDAAGALVRAAAYLSVFFLGNLLQFDEGEIQDTFSTHLLYVYSILLSTAISIGKESLTRFHTEIIAMILGSPLTFALFIYAVFGTLGHTHRPGLNGILGPGRKTLIYRLLAASAFVIWLAGLIYTELPSNSEKFAQWACDPRVASDALFVLSVLPYMSLVFIIYGATAKNVKGAAYWLVFAIPVAVYVIAVLGSLFFARKELMHEKEIERKGIWWRIWHKWVVLREKFPCLHWLGVHVLPTIYWIFMTELNIFADSDGFFGHDNHFELTFGQILAVSVILKPLWQNIMLLFSTRKDGRNRLIFWFINLRWMQLMTGRPPVAQQMQTREVKGGELSDYELGQGQVPQGMEGELLVKESSRNGDLGWK